MESVEIIYDAPLLSCYITIPMGLIGNLLSIILFSTKQFLKQSVSVYLITICCLNIFDILQIPNKLQLFSYSNDLQLACKLSSGIIIYLNLMHTWLAVIATIDCQLTIIKPLKFGFKRIKKLQIGLISMVFVLVFIGSFPMFYIKTTYFTFDSNITICSYPLEFDYLWGKYYTLFTITLFTCVIPYSIMIVSIVYLIKALRKPKEQEVFADKERTQEIDSAKMIIAYDLLLMINSSPSFVYNTYFDFSNNLISETVLVIAEFLKIFSFIFFLATLRLLRSVIWQGLKNIFCFCVTKESLRVTEKTNQVSQVPHQEPNELIAITRLASI